MTFMSRFPGNGSLSGKIEGIVPFEILARLPAMGRIVLRGTSAGVQHERIGPVHRVGRSGGTALVHGACHEAIVDLAALSGIVIHRAPDPLRGSDPRLDFLDMGGMPIFSVVGIDGFGRFDPVLSRMQRSPVRHPARPPIALPSPCPSMPSDDPARWPFCRLCDTGAEVAIVLDRVGLRQVWRGRIEAFHVASGFLDVISEDFGLQIPAGAVAGWQVGAGRIAAIGPEGRPIGLCLASEAFA